MNDEKATCARCGMALRWDGTAWLHADYEAWKVRPHWSEPMREDAA